MIPRYRTALSRRFLSKPMRLALEANLIRDPHLDYGCGQGDDVRALAGKGFQAEGFDPSWCPRDYLLGATYGSVSLIYVLNVIEVKGERQDVLKRAWGLCSKGLLVAVRTDGKNDISQGKIHRDGILTQTGTFQHYYSHKELVGLLGDLIPKAKITKLAAGVVYLSREDD